MKFTVRMLEWPARPDVVAERCRDMRPLLDFIGEHGKRSIDENFRAGGRPEPWQELKATTLYGGIHGRRLLKNRKTPTLSARFRKYLAGKKILINRGRLKNSINVKTGRTSVTWGTNLVYAAIHNFGGPIPRHSPRFIMPKRPFMVLQTEDLRRFRLQIERYFSGDSTWS